MINKNIPSFAAVSIIYLFSDIDKERLLDVYKFILSMNLKKTDIIYLIAYIVIFFIAAIGFREIFKTIIQRIEVRRGVMIEALKKKLEKKHREKR